MIGRITLLMVLSLFVFTQSSLAQCSDLFFSEYIEGSSSNKALEIYNPTGAAVDMSNYEVRRFNNGSLTATDSIVMNGMLAAHDVYIIGNSGGNATILAESDTTHTMTFYNGDDAIVLINLVTGDTLDGIGEIGVDPGAGWTVGTGATNNFTLRRMSSIQQGNTDWTTGVNEWDVFAIDDVSDLGMHSSSCAATTCNELFFSEYIEGSSSNKALEVYNPTAGMIDMSNYVIYRYNNGSLTATDSLFPQGMVAGYDVYVVGNAGGNATILAESDTTHTMTFYNGDDAIILVNTATGDTIDGIGEIGVDPGAGWTVGTGATNNFTLRRMSTIQKGNPDWATGVNEWDVYAIDDVSDLGMHSSSCSPLPINPTVSFAMTAMTVNEGAGTISFDVEIANSGMDTVAVDVSMNMASTATNGTDFTWSDTTIVFPANATMPISLSATLIDDSDVEGLETIVIDLSNATNGAAIGDTTLTVTIADNESGGGGCDELFFSEYIEGSSSNKALEIYNPTGGMIDMSDYAIYRFNNGSTSATDSLFPQGMLASLDVFVIGNPSANATILAESDTTHTMTFYNGDDAIILINTATGDTLDAIGEIGVDPGSGWTVGAGATNNFTLRRMSTVNAGNTNWSVGATEWDVFPIDDVADLGMHTSDCASTGCDELFFSEYIEGSSSNKALEIYNPTNAMVDLSDYAIYRFNNGSTSATDSLFPQGMLSGYEVFVIGNPSGNATILAESDTLHTMTFYNGDDALILINTMTGDTLDAIGEIGVDPGSSWTVGSGATQNYTLRRMSTVKAGNTDWAVGATEWDVFPIDDVADLGMHTSDCAIVTGCDELFFSEYIEGSSSNKALEIYNPTNGMVDLSHYEVRRFNNGGTTASDSLVLDGMLAAYDVYVIGNAGGNATILAESDTTHSMTFYNGDDAIILINTMTGDTIDGIGEIGVDPGSGWPVGTGATNNTTLRRMFNISEGNTDWAVGATEWDVFANDDVSDLGEHSSACEPPSNTPEVSFSTESLDVNEGDGTISFDVEITNSGADTVAVDIAMAMAGSAALGTDFTWADTTISFPANATMPVTLNIGLIDDSDVEGDETIVLGLSNATNGAAIGDTILVITIEDNDYPVYPIALVTEDANGDGHADSLGVRCQVQGIVHGIDIQGGNAIEFTFIDSTGGIHLYSNNDFGYTVTEGDEVIVQGEVDEFNALVQMSPDTIIVVSTGNPTVTPVSVTTLDETTENELVVLECFSIIDTTQWPSSGGGSVNLDVTNGTDTLTMRIDSDTDINGTPAPTAKWLTITGLGGQFAFGNPDTADFGYQILPNFITDIVENPDPTVGFASDSISEFESAGSVMVMVAQADGNPDTTMLEMKLDSVGTTATVGVDFLWDDFTLDITGCGTDTFSVPVTLIDDLDVEGDEFVSIFIASVTNNATVSIDTLVITIVDDATDAIDDLLPAHAIKLYPNPVSSRLFLEADYRLEAIRIYNLMGQELIRQDLNAQQAELTVGHLPNGVYLIKVETSEGIWTSRFIRK